MPAELQYRQYRIQFFYTSMVCSNRYANNMQWMGGGRRVRIPLPVFLARGCVTLPRGNRCASVTRLLTDYGKTVNKDANRECASPHVYFGCPQKRRGFSVRSPASTRPAFLCRPSTPKPLRVREVNNMDHSRGAVFCLERLAFPGMFFGSQPPPALFHTE